MRKIIFGIRQSGLARVQLNEFISYLVKKEIDVEFEIKTIKTGGDKNRSIPIEDLGEGIFTKEIERALLFGDIDCAVHSLKDMPVKIEEGTVLSCFSPRADVRDCLVCRDGVSSDCLKGLRIATGSPRRTAFIREIESDVDILPLRGNVDTRLRKLENGEFDAMVLAACGLKRIGHEDKISLYFDSNTFVPAAGQGAICTQTRQNDPELNSTLRDLSCRDTELAVKLERRILKELGVGCRMPLGVFARFADNIFIITAKAYVKEKNSYIFCTVRGSKENCERITEALMRKVKKKLNGCSVK